VPSTPLKLVTFGKTRIVIGFQNQRRIFIENAQVEHISVGGIAVGIPRNIRVDDKGTIAFVISKYFTSVGTLAIIPSQIYYAIVQDQITSSG
jgi:hypothetical protein